MAELFKEALNLPESLRYQLALLLLHSLEPKMVEEVELTKDQLKMLYEAKASIESGKEKLLSHKELKASIRALREERKKAS